MCTRYSGHIKEFWTLGLGSILKISHCVYAALLESERKIWALKCLWKRDIHPILIFPGHLTASGFRTVEPNSFAWFLPQCECRVALWPWRLLRLAWPSDFIFTKWRWLDQEFLEDIVDRCATKALKSGPGIEEMLNQCQLTGGAVMHSQYLVYALVHGRWPVHISYISTNYMIQSEFRWVTEITKYLELCSSVPEYFIN
jgi:hypothetical protein